MEKLWVFTLLVVAVAAAIPWEDQLDRALSEEPSLLQTSSGFFGGDMSIEALTNEWNTAKGAMPDVWTDNIERICKSLATDLEYEEFRKKYNDLATGSENLAICALLVYIDYSAQYYNTMNSILRGSSYNWQPLTISCPGCDIDSLTRPGGPALPAYLALIRLARRGLTLLPAYDKYSVYRGMKEPPHVFDLYNRQGANLCFKIFTSTAFAPGVSTMYANVPKDEPVRRPVFAVMKSRTGAFLGALNEFEKEVLLPPNTAFAVKHAYQTSVIYLTKPVKGYHDKPENLGDHMASVDKAEVEAKLQDIRSKGGAVTEKSLGTFKMGRPGLLVELEEIGPCQDHHTIVF